MQDDIDYADAKIKFIKGVIEQKIELRNQAESAIIKQAEAYSPILVGKVEKFLTLPMRSLTKEEIAKLRKKSAELKQDIADYSKNTFEEILIDDLKALNL